MTKPKYTSMGCFVREDMQQRVKLQASDAYSFGRTEGSKGAVAMVLRCDGTTMAFINCHLAASHSPTSLTSAAVAARIPLCCSTAKLRTWQYPLHGISRWTEHPWRNLVW